jgi:hypothetical protein
MNFIKIIQPLIGLFTFISIAFLTAKSSLATKSIDANVVLIANALFFLLYSFTVGLHSNATNHKNPNVAIRTSMITSFLKLFVLIGAVAVYKYSITGKISWITVIISMVLYLIYSFVEIRIVSKLKKQHGNS